MADVPTVPEETETRAGNSNRCLLLICIAIGAALLTVAVVTASVCGTGNCGGTSAADGVREIETLEACSLARCYLIDVETLEEEEISGNFAFLLNRENRGVFSIRCDPADDGVRFLDFFYDGEFHRESSAPFYMEGNDGDYNIEPIWQLSRCGNKSFRIATDRATGDLGCSEEIFELTAVCNA